LARLHRNFLFASDIKPPNILNALPRVGVAMRSKRLITALCLVVAALCFAPPALAHHFVLHTGEWPPYVSSTLPGGGPLARIVSEALALQGHSVEFHFEPWARQEQDVREGRDLATFPWSSNDAINTDYVFSQPLAHHRMVFFYLTTRTPGFDFTTLENLKNFRLGGSRGYEYVHIFREAGLKPDYAPDAASSFRKLLAGRIDLVPESEAVGLAILKDFPPEQIGSVSIAKTPLYIDSLRVMASNRHPDTPLLLEALNVGLPKLRRSGRWDAILRESGLPRN
jgi:polar amino acid transport system substrate-binding protein